MNKQMDKCTAKCKTGYRCKNRAKAGTNHFHLPSHCGTVLIRINGQVFETSYDVLVEKSGFIRTLFDDGNLEPSEEDGIYDLGEISIETRYIEHLIDYINTRNLDFKDIENLTFLQKMETTCAYFDVDIDIDTEEVYFFHNAKKDYRYHILDKYDENDQYDDNEQMPPQPVVRMYNIDIYPHGGKVPDFDYPLTMVGGISIKKDIFIVYELKSKLRVAKYCTFKHKWMYDLDNRNSPPKMMEAAKVVVVGTDTFVIDGIQTNMYDTIRDEWYKYSPPIGVMPFIGAVCAVNDDIFYFRTESFLKKIQKFSTKTKIWTQLNTQFPLVSGDSACLMEDGRVYIFGKNICCFNPSTEYMESPKLNSLFGFRGTSSGNTFVYNEDLYVTDKNQEIQKYRTGSKKWKYIMNVPRGMLGIVVKGRRPDFFTVKKILKISSLDIVEDFDRATGC
jgi:hypothetical protein